MTLISKLQWNDNTHFERVAFASFFPRLERFGEDALESIIGNGARVVLFQHIHQVGDVAGGQLEGLDFRELCVQRHVWNAVAEIGEGAVDADGAATLFFVGGDAALHHTDSWSEEILLNICRKRKKNRYA